jgi:(R)-citramalate synthase
MNNHARTITLMDTTLRDGEQTHGVSFSPEEKINIAKALLQSLKVDRIEVASAGVSKGEQQAVSAINDWARQNGYGDQVEVLGFVDYKRSVDWIKTAGGSVLNLLTKGSEKHCREQLGRTLQEHIADIHQTVAYALEQGIAVNVYLEDWSNGYKDSRGYVYGLMDAIKTIGINHFMLPDTLGVMSPAEVRDSLSDMINRYPDLQFDFHPHNDYGLATANVMAAVEAGVSSIHCTVNCLGERAGNASVAEVAAVLKDKLGVNLNIDESNIVMLSEMVENFSGKWVAANTPVVGADVFTQTAGIHADGDYKGGLYVSKLTPERFSRTRSYALGKLSGKASIAKNLESLGITLSDENLKKVLERVVKLGDSKEHISPDDLPFIIADVLESKDINYINLVDCQISSQWQEPSEVALTVELQGETFSASARGNGGFDAFIHAIDDVLGRNGHKLPELLNYEVRIPKGGHTDALTECIITWSLQGREIKTRGVNANQVFAAVLATLRVINLMLSNDYS